MVAVILPETSRNGIFQDVGIPETSRAPYKGRERAGEMGYLIW